MQTLVLSTPNTDDQGTKGGLVLPSGKMLYSLELPWRDNHHDFSCIPEGVYTCRRMPSARMTYLFGAMGVGDMYEVLGVKDRDGVFLHAGTWAGDVTKTLADGVTKLLSSVEGCILLGLSVAPDTQHGNQYGIFSTRLAITQLIKEMKGADFQLQVIRNFPPAELPVAA